MSRFTIKQRFDTLSISKVPNSSGVYIIYDSAGPIYVGRSGVSIRHRLQVHLRQSGNRIIARAIQIGASDSLSFTYYKMLSGVDRDAEAYLIQELGVDKSSRIIT